MVSTVSCHHCGDEHEAGERRCPRTNELMSDPGPCGTKIDRYLVKKLLGVGGFGAVYEAVHTRTDAKVALKVLRHDRADDAASVERFMREARAAAMLGSEHIARTLDADVTPEGVAFITMELLEGTDLSELDKKKGPLHPERLVNIMIQACSALQAAHDKGIVHRDMKPANIFITKRKDAMGVERDFVKLLDFGISKMQARGERALTLAGTTMGTPAYMAYEQFFDARSVDGRADVYSVAAMLYELLSRQRPYVASSYGELVMKVEKETPLPVKQVAPMLPDALCAVIDKGLKKDRDERWQSATALAEALTKVGSLRSVQLKTEISYGSIPAVPMDVETKIRAPTTEPRGDGVQRGEVKTVMMESPVIEVAPDSGKPSPREGAGNATVLMSRADYEASAPKQQVATEPVGTPAVGRLDDDTSQKPTDPNRMMMGPREDEPQVLSAPVADAGGPFGLGWKLVGMLGAGALIVISMLIWVIVLARRGR
ncbi:MAG: serine/threonine protein kinase [Myxococcaceae bacterium]|nr:serine/threonine protein kinase [Myxococcaceae bacterium]